MDRQSPIYTALVSQTEQTIAGLRRDIEAFRAGNMRLTSDGRDISAEWAERLEGWLADNERLLADLQEGRI